eukprot:6285389-Amphidinium_carterae.1
MFHGSRTTMRSGSRANFATCTRAKTKTLNRERTKYMRLAEQKQIQTTMRSSWKRRVCLQLPTCVTDDEEEDD